MVFFLTCHHVLVADSISVRARHGFRYYLLLEPHLSPYHVPWTTGVSTVRHGTFCSHINHTFTDHWHDVLVGSAVGLIFSYFSYRQYFPSLASPLSHRPYSPRIEREDEPEEGLPTHIDSIPNDPTQPGAHEDMELADGTVKRPNPIDVKI